jgi:hypothetical protein
MAGIAAKFILDPIRMAAPSETGNCRSPAYQESDMREICRQKSFGKAQRIPGGIACQVSLADIGKEALLIAELHYAFPCAGLEFHFKYKTGEGLGLVADWTQIPVEPVKALANCGRTGKGAVPPIVDYMLFVVARRA